MRDSFDGKLAPTVVFYSAWFRRFRPSMRPCCRRNRRAAFLMASFWDFLPVDKLAQTWPARMGQSIGSALMAPGHAYQSTTPITTEQMVAPAADLAGLVMGGSYAAPAIKGGAGMGIRAYHGSPYDFDKFDLSKIGTGEGAQAYGHGLYFAGNPATAADYRKKLAGPSTVADDAIRAAVPPGVELKNEHLQALRSFAATAARDEGSAAEAAKRLQWRFPELRDDSFAGSGGDFHKALTAAVEKTRDAARGRMYEVNINAHPDQFLDWDKPLSGQGEVKDALTRILGQGVPESATGSQMHRSVASRAVSSLDPALRGIRGEDQIAASSMMRGAGIPGIKYLDQGSRGAGDGSRNYVVFDDKIIDILKKYGIAGMGMIGLGAGQQHPVLGME
jgi:hypothetical protein